MLSTRGKFNAQQSQVTSNSMSICFVSSIFGKSKRLYSSPFSLLHRKNHSTMGCHQPPKVIELVLDIIVAVHSAIRTIREMPNSSKRSMHQPILCHHDNYCQPYCQSCGFWENEPVAPLPAATAAAGTSRTRMHFLAEFQLKLPNTVSFCQWFLDEMPQCCHWFLPNEHL